MISFLIPTVYKAPQLPQLIKDLDACDLVTEIILYENAPNNGMLDNIYSNKMIIKEYTENVYCNGAWNYGARHSKNYYYALCNDDINFDTKLVKDVLHFYQTKDNLGFIGMNTSQFHDIYGKPLIYGIQQREWYLDFKSGWGVLIFNHKDNNVIIPEDMKQWCGDDYYIYYSKYPCYDYLGFKVHTPMSVSTDETLMSTVCKQDCYNWEQKYKLEKPLWA